jgi:hypothetical protein
LASIAASDHGALSTKVQQRLMLAATCATGQARGLKALRRRCWPLIRRKIRNRGGPLRTSE